MGRHSEFTQEIANKICNRLADGESLRTICKDEDMPSRETVRLWLADERYKSFLGQYARAREEQADHYFEESIDIADNGSNDWMEQNDPENPGFRLNGEHVQRSRLRVDIRKWAASKLAPKKYGDKLDMNLGGQPENPVKTENKLDVTAKVLAAIPQEKLEELLGSDAGEKNTD